MGVFSEVVADCPSCGRMMSIQLKGPGCDQYFIGSEMPPEVMYEVAGETMECDHCGKAFKLRLTPSFKLEEN